MPRIRKSRDTAALRRTCYLQREQNWSVHSLGIGPSNGQLTCSQRPVVNNDEHMQRKTKIHDG